MYPLIKKHIELISPIPPNGTFKKFPEKISSKITISLLIIQPLKHWQERKYQPSH